MKEAGNNIFKAILRSYAILFFSQNRVFGGLLLLATFFHPQAGATGLLFTIASVVYAWYSKFPKAETEKGFYSFNTLLLGLAFGTFYHFTFRYCVWATFGCFACILITALFAGWSHRRNLPYLSLPFVVTFCIIFAAANSVFNLGLEQRSSIILNELTEKAPVHSSLHYVELFFRSLGAVVFQDDIVAGVLIAAGLLIHSRIAFSLAVIGFVVAVLLNAALNTYPEGISYYHLGGNIMLTVLALGSFFQVPKLRSYLLALAGIPVIFLLINALTKLFGIFDLPVISLPFCFASLLFIRFLVFSKSKLFPVSQTYSPEINLYQHTNSAERLNDLQYFDIKLPFLGEWFVTQGYNGGITHKSEWGQALDFVIRDEENKTYKGTGTIPEHYLCYGKPVLACGNGVVEEVVDHIHDNAVGDVNLQDNWGNCIVIKHTNGLYSKVSHLQPGSAKVQAGDYVEQGDIIGLCGNSGRSPEPHLHFQVQSTPYIGSKTLSYPFSSFLDFDDDLQTARFHDTPAEGHSVKRLVLNDVLRRSFEFRPGYVALLVTGKKTETIEVQVDELNTLSLFSKETNSRAYFINNGTSHYFTSFEGSKKSILYLFYLAAYKVTFANDVEVGDSFPFYLEPASVLKTIQDFAAPFYQFVQLRYRSITRLGNGSIHVETNQQRQVFSKIRKVVSADIQINSKGIQSFEIIRNDQKTTVEWVGRNI